MYQHTTAMGTSPTRMGTTPYDHLMDDASHTFTVGDGIVLGGALVLVAGSVLIARHAPAGSKGGRGDRGTRRSRQDGTGGKRTPARKRSTRKRTWPSVAP